MFVWIPVVPRACLEIRLVHHMLVWSPARQFGTHGPCLKPPRVVWSSPGPCLEPRSLVYTARPPVCSQAHLFRAENAVFVSPRPPVCSQAHLFIAARPLFVTRRTCLELTGPLFIARAVVYSQRVRCIESPHLHTPLFRGPWMPHRACSTIWIDQHVFA